MRPGTKAIVGQPAGRPPAPGELALVQAFLNTVCEEIDRELLETPADLRAWLVEAGLLAPDAPVVHADLAVALHVRGALRDWSASGDPGPGAAALADAAAAARLTLRGDRGRLELVPQAGGVAGALGALLAIVHAADADGRWSRLKSCRGHGCHWVFYDGSRNRSGAWCSMRICGNRTKARAFRAREAGGHSHR